MDNELMINLINTGVIKPGTELGILRLGNTMDGRLTAAHLFKVYTEEDKNGDQKPIKVKANHIVEVYDCGITDDGIAFVKAHSTVDGNKFVIGADHIRLIDYMLPEKIAKVYGFNPDGSKRKQGKKRGRKRKIRE